MHRDARTIGTMIEARQPTMKLPTYPEQRAGPLSTIEPSPQPPPQHRASSNSRCGTASLSVPFRP